MAIRVSRQQVGHASSPLEEGIYRSRLVSVDDVDASTGAKMWKVVAEHAADGRTIRKFYQIVYQKSDGESNDVGAGVVNDIVSSVGAWNDDDSVNEERLIGTPFLATLDIEPNDGYGARNVIVGARAAPPKEQPKPAAQSADPL